jgi:hypothetical protein
MLALDYATFNLLVEEGKKVLLFVERALRGKTFQGLEEMCLPEAVVLHSEPAIADKFSRGGAVQKKMHTLLSVSVFHSPGRRGRVQPFFNVRRWLEQADGKMIPMTQGTMLNFKEFHTLVYCASEYFFSMEEEFAKPRVAHDEMKMSLEVKMTKMMRNFPGVDFDSHEFIFDDESDHHSDDNDESDDRLILANEQIAVDLSPEKKPGDDDEPFDLSNDECSFE